jgi:hypothetical protein
MQDARAGPSGVDIDENKAAQPLGKRARKAKA